MKIICAWCSKEIGFKPPLNDNSVTHGICLKCGNLIYKQVQKNNASAVDVTTDELQEKIPGVV